MENIFVLVTILGHLPVILSAKRKGSDNMKQILIVEDDNLLNKTLTYNLELDGYSLLQNMLRCMEKKTGRFLHMKGMSLLSTTIFFRSLVIQSSQRSIPDSSKDIIRVF